jgi:hypothetical protein
VPAFLERVSLAPRQARKSLTLWPLVERPDAVEPTGPVFVALVDALNDGFLHVDEVDASGRVPHVGVRNDGTQAVLVLFGEEMRGAKQDRIANASFLVPAQSDLMLDVSCVEQGRWGRSRGARFRAGPGVVSQSMRRSMSRRVSEARAVGCRFDADQLEVWGEVAARVRAAAPDSSTQAYADYLDTRESDLGQILQAFDPVEGQIGFVAALGDEVVGLEAVGRREVFARVFRRLLRAYAIDAADVGLVKSRTGQPEGTGFDAPEPFLDALGQAEVRDGPSLGLGQDLRIRGERLEGCALDADGIVHLTAFSI